jgi:hypothetical protein
MRERGACVPIRKVCFGMCCLARRHRNGSDFAGLHVDGCKLWQIKVDTHYRSIKETRHNVITAHVRIRDGLATESRGDHACIKAKALDFQDAVPIVEGSTKVIFLWDGTEQPKPLWNKLYSRSFHGNPVPGDLKCRNANERGLPFAR